MKKGFTLVEILAVVVLLLVVMLFTTPVLKKLINNGDEKERALIEERILIAAKEYASSYDNGFYDKLVNVGDYNFVYKTDLLKSGLIELDDLDKLDRLVGVKGELLVDDKVKYTLSYIDNNINSNDYSNEELYTMLQGMLTRLTNLEQNSSGSSGGEGGSESSISSILDAYPVGSIYTSVNNINPGTLFGGTWVSFGSGKTLVGVDTNNSKFNTVEKTGGNESVSYTPIGTVGSHALTVAELPSHTHSIPSLSGTAASAGSHSHEVYSYDGTVVSDYSGSVYGYRVKPDSVANGYPFTTKSAGAHTHSVTTNASTTGGSGSGSGHNHSFSGTASNIDILNPYITVYMWKRTA